MCKGMSRTFLGQILAQHSALHTWSCFPMAAQPARAQQGWHRAGTGLAQGWHRELNPSCLALCKHSWDSVPCSRALSLGWQCRKQTSQKSLSLWYLRENLGNLGFCCILKSQGFSTKRLAGVNLWLLTLMFLCHSCFL